MTDCSRMLQPVAIRLSTSNSVNKDMLRRNMCAGNLTSHKIAPVPSHQLKRAITAANKVEDRRSVIA